MDYATSGCRFNRSLDCTPICGRCNVCGWNPAVRRERLEIYRMKLQAQKSSKGE